ncbi:MAG: hypothetical protein L0220_29465, partial [Acidobacteria bacterium]|nr:hypothetical protein [Acidobacteriota bacterium]
GLISDLSASMPETERFGCNGMAQYHTEPKLLNYLCATPEIRENAFRGAPYKDPIPQSVLENQREEAAGQAERMKGPEDIASVTLVTEIDCCRTCERYSVKRFRARFPDTPLQVIELGKEVKGKVPPQYKEVKVKTLK